MARRRRFGEKKARGVKNSDKNIYLQEVKRSGRNWAGKGYESEEKGDKRVNKSANDGKQTGHVPRSASSFAGRSARPAPRSESRTATSPARSGQRGAMTHRAIECSGVRAVA